MHILRSFIVVTLLVITHQGMAQGRLFTVTRPDGSTWLYHNLDLGRREGINIYRSEGDSLVKINPRPVFPASGGNSLRRQLGESLTRELLSTTGEQSATRLYLRLQTDYELTLLLQFTYPELAQALATLYVDENSPVNTTVTYRVEAVDENGASTDLSVEQEVTLTPFSPSPPDEFTVSIEGNYAGASWTHEPGDPFKISGYHLYYREEGTTAFVRANEVLQKRYDQSTFIFTYDLPMNGNTYEFYATTVGITRQESEPSATVSLTLNDQIPPQPPGALKGIKIEDRYVALNWQTSVEPDVAGYRVYRTQEANGNYDLLTDELLDLLNTVYVDSSSVPGNQYAYAVTAVDSAGNESDQSVPVSFMIEDRTAPDAPLNLQATYQDNGSVLLEWETPGLANDFRTFTIIRRQTRSANSKGYTQVNDGVWRENQFTDEGVNGNGLIDGAFYEYGLIAVDSATNFSDTAFLEIQIPDLVSPDPPGSLSARARDEYAVELNWNASTSQDVVQYNLYRKTPATTDSLLQEFTFNQRYYNDRQVTPGEEYIYTVTALDSMGNESSKVMRDTLLFRDPNPPASIRNVQAVAGNGTVTIQWEPSLEEDVSGYLVYRAQIATGIYEPLVNTPLEENNYTDSQGEAGYWYKVKAVDISENEGKFSNAAQAINLEQ